MKAFLYSAADWRDQLKTLLAGRALTVVYDPVGGDFADPALRSLSPGGRYLVIGFASGTIPKFAANLTLLKQISIVGVNWGGHIMIHPEASQPVIDHLLSRIQARQLNPEAGQCFALADAGFSDDRHVRPPSDWQNCHYPGVTHVRHHPFRN